MKRNAQKNQSYDPGQQKGTKEELHNGIKNGFASSPCP